MNIKSTLDYLARYAFSSACAVLFDLALYVLLVKVFGVTPFVANIISSVLSVVVVWFFSGKYLFAKHKITLAGYITWYGYQFVAILVYSGLVAGLVKIDVDYLLSKIIVIGISFVINSIFFKQVVLKKRTPESAE